MPPIALQTILIVLTCLALWLVFGGDDDDEPLV